jgi:hypothetical protein
VGLKKVLSALFFGFVALLVTGGIFVYYRASKNPEQIFPLPYEFTSKTQTVGVTAPILITGDRMGAQFAKYIPDLATTISANLDNKIKIQSLAQPGHGLHRTIHQLEGLAQWPQIVIYQGGSEEYFEKSFELSEIKTIRTNFERYQDDRIQTALMLYPWLSRLVYEPLKRVKLEETPQQEPEVEEAEYLKRLEMEHLLFEQQLTRLAQMSKDRGSLLILSTTPINLDISPKRVCAFTTNLDIEKVIVELRELLADNNPKVAYTKASEAIKLYAGNSLLYYIHGQSAKRLGLRAEAMESLLRASAYDCDPWRATEVTNSIIRRVAESQQILLFDFALYTQKFWGQGPTFFDELYPQNLYYQRGSHQLGLVIKNILKL